MAAISNVEFLHLQYLS